MARKSQSKSASVLPILHTIFRAKARAIRGAGGKRAWRRQIDGLARELEKEFTLRDRLTQIIADAPVIMNDDPEENARLEREVKAAMDRYNKRARRPK